MVKNLITSVIQKINLLNEVVGRVTSWLILSLVLTTFSVAIFRYGFNLGWVWLQELYVWMHGAIIMLGAAYTLLHDGHVRIDIFYRSAGPRAKAWVNLLGSLFFLLPTIATVGWFILPYVMLSWQRLEASREAGGMHGLFIWKTTMLLFCVLVFFQGVALVLNSLMTLCYKNSPSKYDAGHAGS